MSLSDGLTEIGSMGAKAVYIKCLERRSITRQSSPRLLTSLAENPTTRWFQTWNVPSAFVRTNHA